MKKRKYVTILIITTIIFGTISLSFGKYIYNSAWNYYLSSKDFYFESDELDINTKKNSLLKWDGSDVYFSIKNSENGGLISNYDITYKLTCEVLGDEADYIDCQLNGSNSNVYNGTLSTESYCINDTDSTDVSNLEKMECEINGYTWHEEVAKTNNYFNLILTDDTKNIDEVSVQVKAESLTPYSKTLTGIFNLNKLEENESDIIINYQNYSEYDELTLTNISSQKKCVEIKFEASNYNVDLDDIVYEYSVDENNKINKIGIEVLNEKSVVKQFYKLNLEKEYSINDFVITEKEC